MEWHTRERPPAKTLEEGDSWDDLDTGDVFEWRSEKWERVTVGPGRDEGSPVAWQAKSVATGAPFDPEDFPPEWRWAAYAYGYVGH